VEVVPLNGHTEAELLERAASLEMRSEHPLAKAIVAYAREKGVTIQPAANFQILQGKGGDGRCRRHSVLAGLASLFGRTRPGNS